jgi:hypothetical protein
MKKAQTIRKRRLTVPVRALKRRNLLEEEIPSPYSVEEEGN